MSRDCFQSLFGRGQKQALARRLCPDTGKITAEVSTPGVLRASSCMFGGYDLRTLYITTCSQDFGEISSEPLPEPAGALFSVRLPKEFPPGLPEPSFAA